MMHDPARMRSRYSSLDACAQVRLVTLGDGAERGVRVIEMRSGGGLEAEIVVDRGFDIGRLAINGTTVSWHAPGGYAAPWLVEAQGEQGQGFLRAMSGFLSTCGYDHIRQPETEAADLAPLHPTAQINYPLHGSGAHQPARLIGYGIDEDAECPVLWAEGEVTQSMQFRGALRLRRRIEIPLGGDTLSLCDRVSNIGAFPMTSMMLYHCNLGYPLIDDATILSMEDVQEVWHSQDHDIYAPFGPPLSDFVSELSVHRPNAPGEMAHVRVNNPTRGLTLTLGYDTATLPALQLLRLRGAGLYMLGIEPGSTGHRSRSAARAADELPVLAPGASRAFALDLRLSQTAPQPTGT